MTRNLSSQSYKVFLEGDYAEEWGDLQKIPDTYGALFELGYSEYHKME